MSQKKLSKIQQKIYDYLKKEISEKGYPPTVREICKYTKLSSTSSVHAHLTTLEKNGFIKRDPSKPRAIYILDDEFNASKQEMINVPIVGDISAGKPILAEQNISTYFPIPAAYFKPNDEGNFMLTVHGESMINIGINDGDFIIAEVCNSVKNGEVVVALIDDSATVKTYYKENGKIRLQPENDFMNPIIVDNCKILGRVRGVFRFI